MLERKKEVRKLLSLTPEEVIKRAGDHLVVCENLEDLHRTFAKDIFNEIKSNNNNGYLTRLILPVGPTGQYPILVNLIEKEDMKLNNCWFFFMDEYCDDDGFIVPMTHPLSLKKIAKMLFLIPLKETYGINDTQVYFPDESNISKLQDKIEEIGGIDTCYGGIGIHGHLAFNEPAPRISTTNPRKVKLNSFALTMNAIRAETGGNLENFPHNAYTLGMNQILNARRIRLYCRNDSPYDWANTVLRIALFGEPGDDYPVTYVRNHPNYIISTDRNTLETPKNLL
jgi:glucosamine-6-phosphate deaminase